MKHSTEIEQLNEIAIIGMALRLPGAKSVADFWRNLRDGVESVRIFTDEQLKAAGVPESVLADPHYVKASAVLDDIDLFDASFFGFSPREAEITDPQHRLFLECAWEALESAGYDPETCEGRLGVHAGAGFNTYLFNLLSRPDIIQSVGTFQAMMGNSNNFLATLASYKLNLRGPGITVQTACSTSLVAVHLACQSLLNGESDMELAGGSSITVPQKVGYMYQEGGINSPDGHCRAFDARAQGTVGGSGVALVVLKRLSDAVADGDRIHAVIKGSAINNDGSAKIGYTAPSIEGQAEVVAEALSVASVEAETVTYVETHGTGTPMGDPIEVAALTKAFRSGTDKKGFCAIGSVKTNIGHTDTAAGVAGLIKTVLALEHRMLPPSLHFEEPNPQIDFADGPFYVNSALADWVSPGSPRRAGVSSFGIGGTNAHVVLEEAPESARAGSRRRAQLLLISARTPGTLERATAGLGMHLGETEGREIELADVAYTLQVGRRGFAHRRALVASDLGEAAIALASADARRLITGRADSMRRPVAFMFSGQGTQYVHMGEHLYETEPTFREEIDRGAELLRPLLGCDLREVIYAIPERADEATQQLQQTWLTQPALFVTEHALARLWMSWGVSPAAMIGHSLGEYVAACVAGVFSLEDALRLVAARSRLMQEVEPGAMLSVELSEDETLSMLGEELSLASVNGARQCVVAGRAVAVESLAERLRQGGAAHKLLRTSHAFHSSMMDGIKDAFGQEVKRVALKAPQIPYVSNVTGRWIKAEEATSADYWVRHMRQTVRLSAGLNQLLEDKERVLLEVGPGRVLSRLARQQVQLEGQQQTATRGGAEVAGIDVVTSLRTEHERVTDQEQLMRAAGQLWVSGVDLKWEAMWHGERRMRVPLPTYPFERQRFWVEMRRPERVSNELQTGNARSESEQENIPVETAATYERPALADDYAPPSNAMERRVAEIWQEQLGIAQVGVHDNFFELGGHSLLATQVLSRLREDFQTSIPLSSLFEAPTVAELSATIEEILIAELENVSEEEAESLLVGAAD